MIRAWPGGGKGSLASLGSAELAVPLCPQCNGEMVLRTARQGQNAGGQFWGCRAFPRCRGTRPHDPEAQPDAPLAQQRESTAPRKLGLPQSVRLTACLPAHTAVFHQHAYAPRSAVQAFSFLDDHPARLACSQWRSEWPVERPAYEDISTPAWLPSVWKLLNAGSVLGMSPSLEFALTDTLGSCEATTEEEWASAARQLPLLAMAPLTRRPSGLDSDSEWQFLSTFATRYTPPGLMRHWLHQVPLSTLCRNDAIAASSQRVDFCFMPPGVKPIVVEIDGGQHESLLFAKDDSSRDALLESSGWTVIRITTKELDQGHGAGLEVLEKALRDLAVISEDDLLPEARWLLAGQVVMQIQSVLTHAIRDARVNAGPGGRITIEVADLPVFRGEDATAIVKAAIDDLNGLIGDVCEALGIVSPAPITLAADGSPSLRLRFSGDDGSGVLVQQSCMPFDALQTTLLMGTFEPMHVARPAAERLLDRVFRHATFREGQFEALERAVCGHDTIVLLPTGAGKSVIYQLAGLLRPGLTIVVAPLISLIEDQITNLRANGLDRVVGISSRSEEPIEELLKVLGLRHFWLCYVAPERFQMDSFRERLRQLTAATPISLVAVDEVHCVSEWGHDFRPAYLNLAKSARTYCSHKGEPPPIIGLTGTASRSVLKDAQRSLEIAGATSVITPRTFDRPELSFEIHQCRSRDKPSVLLGILESLPEAFRVPRDQFFQAHGEKTYAGLVFCIHVNGPYGIMDVANSINRATHVAAKPYGTTTPREYRADQWKEHLTRSTRDFKRNRLPLLVCTTAFGMGIDKPNVRYSIHYNLPKSIESFYQEAGRTGRNREESRCIILYSVDDEKQVDAVLSPAVDRDEVARIVERASWDRQDDVLRNLFFHKESFSGEHADASGLDRLIGELAIDGSTGHEHVSFDLIDEDPTGRQNGKSVEQALQRLVTVGAVSDYSRDYVRKSFTVEKSGADKTAMIASLCDYVSTYQRQRAEGIASRASEWLQDPYGVFVGKLVRLLVGFVYEVVERGRRQALSEILRVCRRAKSSEDIRREILLYLEQSRFTGMLDRLLDKDAAGISSVLDALNEIASPLDAAELRSQCARMLNDYPDQPSIRLLLAAAEAVCTDADADAIRENVLAAVDDAVKRYRLPQADVFDIVVAIGNSVAASNPGTAFAIVQGAVESSEDRRGAVRRLVRGAGTVLRPQIYGLLVSDLNKRVRVLVSGGNDGR